jgi:hypothetical protein
VAERTVVFYECQNVEHQSPFDRVAAASAITSLDDEHWRLNDGSLDIAVIVDATVTMTKTRLFPSAAATNLGQHNHELEEDRDARVSRST